MHDFTNSNEPNGPCKWRDLHEVYRDSCRRRSYNSIRRRLFQWRDIWCISGCQECDPMTFRSRTRHTHTHVHEHADASDYAEITLWTVRQLYIRFKRWLLLFRSLFYVCMKTTKQTAKCEREMRSPIAVHESKTFEFNYTTSIFASLFFSQSIH